MSQLQIEFEQPEDPTQLTCRQLRAGDLFRLRDGNTTFMKVKSIGFLNNSNIISDIFARGDCIVVNLKHGTLTPMPGSNPVVRLSGKLSVKDS